MVSLPQSDTGRFRSDTLHGPVSASGTLVAFPHVPRVGSVAPPLDARKGVGNCDAMEAVRPARILIVDDDPTIQNMVVTYLEEHGMQVSTASGRQEAVRQIALVEPSLIIADLLGRDDGLDLLREIRSRSDVPVIITSGYGGDEIDRVVGLELGADDYITKPFGLRELRARIRAILRRRQNAGGAPRQNPEQGRYRFGEWQLDRRARRLSGLDGKPIVLTKSEYTLLTVFLDSPQRTLSREQLLQATRIHEDIFDRSIDVQVLRLRRKLETDPSSPRIIRTERGIGYIFDLPVERSDSPTNDRSALAMDHRPVLMAARGSSPSRREGGSIIGPS